MKNEHGFRIILTAMFAAMVCVSTIVIQSPSPVGGYVNLGDALVLMSAFLLGPLYGGAAAGIGSALADLITGYAYYAPGTLVIKLLIAVVAALINRAIIAGASGMKQPVCYVIAGIPGEIIMVVGYLFYAWVCLSRGASALASVPGNIAQAAAGIIIAAILTPIVLRPKEIREKLELFHSKKI